MVDQEAAELRAQLASTLALLAEVRHQRDLLERQLGEAEIAAGELRRLLLRQEQPAADSGALTTIAVVGAAQDVSSDAAIREPREPTLGEWWRDIDRMRRIGASLILSALLSFIAAAGFHILLSQHLISPLFRLGYGFAIAGVVLLIAGAGMLF